MNNRILLICLSIVSFVCFGQKKGGKKEPTSKNNFVESFKRISDDIQTNGRAYSLLNELTNTVGSRFSGTKGYENATQWAEQKLMEIGAQKIWKQEVKVPIWERGIESLQIKTPQGDWKSIKMLSFGNSEGTKGKDLIADIIQIKNTKELVNLKFNEVKGKIVFVNLKLDPTIINPMQAYLETAKSKLLSASVIGLKGAKALIIRSLTTDFDDTPHAKQIFYEPEDKHRIPALTIGVKSADELENLLKSGKVIAKINTNAQYKGETINHNIIGEIPGKKDDKVIAIGAQLDSWDFSEGAHDDGAGVAQCLEILRCFSALELENNHTIRVVLYANSENGGLGRDTYAAHVKKNAEKHIMAIGSDAGGYSPRGFSLDMSPQRRKLIYPWKTYFLPYGVYDFEQTTAIQDISPLKKLDIPLVELVVEPQRYLDYHHSTKDTFDKINKRELLLGATVLCQMVHLVDQLW